MSKRNRIQDPITVRKAVPLLEKDDRGANVLMCPFCKPSHPILPFVPSGCGTLVEFQAVQTVYRAKYREGMICVKCGKDKGEMVKFNDGYVHNYDCSPGTTTLTVLPDISLFAKFVFGMKDGRIKKYIQSKMGVASEVKEVTPNGELTGKTLGYFFHRKK